MEIAINIDGTDVSTTAGSADLGKAIGMTTIWLGELGIGSHVIKGRFCSRHDTFPAKISERRLTILLFSGSSNDWKFHRDTTMYSWSSSAWKYDTYGQTSITPSSNCKALIISSLYGIEGTGVQGKKVRLEIDGTPTIDVQNAPNSNDCVNHNFLAVIESLTAGAKNIKIEFASIQNTKVVKIHERQIAILLFPSDLETDFVSDSTQVSTASSTLVDDVQASISRRIYGIRYGFGLYVVTKNHGIASSNTGKNIAVEINDIDYTLNCKGQGTMVNYANNIGIHSDVVTLKAGTYVVNGRFSRNTGTAILSKRLLCMLWFPLEVKGKFYETKTALKIAIQDAIPEGLITGNWRVDIHKIVRNLPFISVRFSPAILWDIYDRNVGGEVYGSISDYHMSIHVFHSNCSEEKGKHAQDVASRIVDYLLTFLPVGWDIDDLRMRESEPSRGAHRISRVIIEGTIHIKRID